MKSLRLFLAAALALAPASAAAQSTATIVFPTIVNAAGQPLTPAPTFDLNMNQAVTDGSGTITAANTSQQAFAANPIRKLLMCQNPIAATEPLFINFGLAAGANGSSFELTAGGSMYVNGTASPTGTINVAAATAGHRFVCKQG